MDGVYTVSTPDTSCMQYISSLDQLGGFIYLFNKITLTQ